MKITVFLFLVFSFLAMLMAALQYGLYYFYVKPIVVDQIYERGKSIGYGFTQALVMPLKHNMKEQAQEIVNITASLEGIAYVFVTNNKNELIASSVNQSVHFSTGFLALMEKQQLSINSLVVHQHDSNTYRNVKLDGQSLYQVSLPISGGDYIGYIAIFNTDVQKALERITIPLIILMMTMLFAAFFFIAIIRSAIVLPIKKLQEHVETLNQNNVYETIKLSALYEIAALGDALDKLREKLRILLIKNRRNSDKK